MIWEFAGNEIFPVELNDGRILNANGTLEVDFGFRRYLFMILMFFSIIALKKSRYIYEKYL